MGQAKNRGTREQRVTAAEQRENAARVGAALASAQQSIAREKAEAQKRQALNEVATLDMRDPPARAVVIGGISPRMRLALAGLGELIDRVGTVSASVAIIEGSTQ